MKIYSAKELPKIFIYRIIHLQTIKAEVHMKAKTNSSKNAKSGKHYPINLQYLPAFEINEASLAMEQAINSFGPGEKPSAIFKLNIYAPNGKTSAMYKFATAWELRNFILLNDIPRYQIWG